MTKTQFGEHLRREREMRGVSLDEITAATRIGTRFLEAIESEQWDRLPGGVFNRAFVRTVARFLGLDEENLIVEYEVAAASEPVSANPLPAPGARSTQLRWNRTFTLVAVLTVGLTAGVWLGRRYSAARVPAGPSHALLTEPRVLSSASMANAAPLDSLIAPRSSPPSSSAGNPASTRTVKPLKEASSLELTISAKKPTSVRVMADGRSVFQSKMAAGEHQRFEAQNRFIVWARDFGAVRLELNEQTVAPPGPVGRAGKISLTQKGVKRMAGGF